MLFGFCSAIPLNYFCFTRRTASATLDVVSFCATGVYNILSLLALRGVLCCYPIWILFVPLRMDYLCNGWLERLADISLLRRVLRHYLMLHLWYGLRGQRCTVGSYAFSLTKNHPKSSLNLGTRVSTAVYLS